MTSLGLLSLFVSFQMVHALLKQLLELGILKEEDGKERNNQIMQKIIYGLEKEWEMKKMGIYEQSLTILM